MLARNRVPSGKSDSCGKRSLPSNIVRCLGSLQLKRVKVKVFQYYLFSLGGFDLLWWVLVSFFVRFLTIDRASDSDR